MSSDIRLLQAVSGVDHVVVQCNMHYHVALSFCHLNCQFESYIKQNIMYDDGEQQSVNIDKF